MVEIKVLGNSQQNGDLIVKPKTVEMKQVEILKEYRIFNCKIPVLHKVRTMVEELEKNI